MRAFGHFLQMAVLFAIMPASVILQLTNTITAGQMLSMLLASVCLFLLGRGMGGGSVT